MGVLKQMARMLVFGLDSWALHRHVDMGHGLGHMSRQLGGERSIATLRIETGVQENGNTGRIILISWSMMAFVIELCRL